MPAADHRRLANGLRLGAVAVFLVATLFHLALVFRPAGQMMGRPLIEDAFYSLSVARTLGAGGSISVDGRTLTNGIQPLICFVYAPVFAVAGDDAIAALRGIILVDLALYVVAALAVGWFASLLTADSVLRATFFWLGAALTLVSYSIAIQALNGLETGLVIAFTFGSVAFYGERIALREAVARGDLVRCGAILGLGVLARIDLAILAAITSFVYLVSQYRRGDVAQGVAGALTIGGVALLVSLPWWLYNLIEFGHLMPISGLAQKDLFVDRLESVGRVLGLASDSLLLTIHAPEYPMWAASALGILIAGAFIAAVMLTAEGRTSLWRSVRRLRTLNYEVIVPLALHVLALAIYYSMFFGAPHFIERYLVAGRLLLSLVATLALAFLVIEGSPRTVRLGVFAVLVLAVISSGAALTRSFTAAASHDNIHLAPTKWIRENVPPSASVGMFQSGTASFFAPNVTNLDGKVNARALSAARAGRLPQWTDSMAFDYIIDWDTYTRHIFTDRVVRSHYRPSDTLAFGFIVWKRIAGS